MYSPRGKMLQEDDIAFAGFLLLLLSFGYGFLLWFPHGYWNPTFASMLSCIFPDQPVIGKVLMFLTGPLILISMFFYPENEAEKRGPGYTAEQAPIISQEISESDFLTQTQMDKNWWHIPGILLAVWWLGWTPMYICVWEYKEYFGLDLFYAVKQWALGTLFLLTMWGVPIWLYLLTAYGKLEIKDEG